MSISYFPSKNIKIFPCANRGTFTDSTGGFDPESRVVSEHNFTHIPGILPGKDSYKISYVEGLLCCVIHGYYIEISGLSEEPKEGYLVLSTKKYRTAIEADGKDSNRYSEQLCDLENGTNTLDQIYATTYKFTALGRIDNNSELTTKDTTINYYYLDLSTECCTVSLEGHSHKLDCRYDDGTLILYIT